MEQNQNQGMKDLLQFLLTSQPGARAAVRGSKEYPSIWGTVLFYSVTGGVLVVYQVFGLPAGNGPCKNPVFGFHIHENGNCTGNDQDPFAAVGTHYNPANCIHPFHAGDLPPLFGNQGYAFGAVFTDRFNIQEVLGRAVVIHSDPDDFTTQPAGNAGKKIACGKIV